MENDKDSVCYRTSPQGRDGVMINRKICPDCNDYAANVLQEELAALREEVARLQGCYDQMCDVVEKQEATLARYREAVEWAIEQIWIGSPDKATTVKELKRRAGRE